MAYLATLKDKKIGVLGLGVSGLSCLSFLLKNQIQPFAMDGDLKSKGVVQVATQWPQIEIYPLPGDIGDYPAVLEDADLLIVSPGIALSSPVLVEANKRNIEIIGDVELFARVNRKPVIAISGSNGKSTVTRLVTLLLQSSGVKAVCGGNIGVAVLDLFDAPFDIAVLELSSFQLETTSSLHADTATILNLSEDHMDRYENYDAYVAAKQRIYSNADVAVYNRLEQGVAPSRQHPSQIAFGIKPPIYDSSGSLDHNHVGISEGHFASAFGGKVELICPLASLRIIGQHNVLNALAAIALVGPFKLNPKVIAACLKQFPGLPHRCERVSGTGDVLWVNDSKATNVGATIAAIEGIKPQCTGKLILIAGGVGKSADFSPLKKVMAEHVDHLITFGQDGDKIARQVPQDIAVRSLEEAVLRAFTLANSGDCVLLSPACASFDMFSSFEARGEHFITLVREVYHEP